MCERVPVHGKGRRAVPLLGGLLLLSACCGGPARGDDVSLDTLPPEFRFERGWQAGPNCGANALFFMLRLNGRPVNRQELIKHLAPPKQGSSLEELQQAARQWGLETKVLRTAPDGVERLDRPFIAHLSLPPNDAGHYLLVLGASGNSFQVIDGTNGSLVELRRGTFYRHWSGYVLVTGTDWVGPLLRLILFVLAAVFLVLTGLALYLHRRGRSVARPKA